MFYDIYCPTENPRTPINPRLRTTNPAANPAYLARVEARLSALKETLRASIPAEVGQITWEVGSGHGHFLTKYAGAYPERFSIGIDILSDRLRKAERKQAVAGAKNLRFLKADAEEFLACLPAGIRISEVVILFPDPWPKKRHHKNRLIQTDFLTMLASRMTSGAHLYFRTDHAPYLEWARDRISSHPEWVLDATIPWVLEEKTVFQLRAPSYGSLVAKVRTPRPIETQAG